MSPSLSSFFPSGWIWAQGVTCGNKESLSVVAGKFTVGMVSPLNFIVHYRYHDGRDSQRITFRSTDGHRFRYRMDGVGGRASIVMTSFLSKRKLVLTLAPQGGGGLSDLSTFGNPIYIPTAKGFSNRPGCKETYTAVASIRYYQRREGGKRIWGKIGGGVIAAKIIETIKNVLAATLWRPTHVSMSSTSSALPTSGIGSISGVNEDDVGEDYTLISSTTFPLTALEYGGSFLGATVASD